MNVIEIAPTEQEALRRYPELAELVTLRQAGWQFVHRLDGSGRVAQVDGYRRWPGGWTDAIGIKAGTDALGIRMTGAEEPDILWQFSGTLPEVVGKLLRLPAPEIRTAPRLVLATAAGFGEIAAGRQP